MYHIEFIDKNLIIGKTDDYFPERKKRVLAIFDNSTSMNNKLNQNSFYTKHSVAKRILRLLGRSIDVLPFNHQLNKKCKIETIAKPSGDTKFSVIWEKIKMYSLNKYGSVLFISDGQPTESFIDAYHAIQETGKYIRNSGLNTVSLVVGIDGDGYASYQFSGDYGYNCFIDNDEKVDFVVNQIQKGLSLNYIQVDNQFIPVSENGEYYYLSSEYIGKPLEPTVEYVKKYLELTYNYLIQQFYSRNNFYLDMVEFKDVYNDLVTETSIALEYNYRVVIINHFKKMMVKLDARLNHLKSRSSVISASHQFIRNF